MRRQRKSWLQRYKKNIAQVLAAVLNILIIFKISSQVYIPFHDRPTELIIICAFNTLNLSVLTLFRTCKVECSKNAIKFLMVIEYVVALTGLLTEVLLIFFTEIELFYYLKYLSSLYLIISVVGIIVLNELLLSSTNGGLDDEESKY